MAAETIDTDIAVVGAGGCGLTAALAAAERGRRVLLLERDAAAGGSTAMSAGIFVAAGSAMQLASGESGTPEELAADIARQNRGEGDPAVTQALCRASGPLMDWLAELGVPLEHMPAYRYPGMRRAWLHSPPQRDGSVITNRLFHLATAHPAIDLRLGVAVTGLRASNGAVVGLTARTPAPASLTVSARAVVLAAAGFGANSALVARHVPAMAGATYFGAPYATGEAIEWGRALGAAVAHMTAFQAHSSIAEPGHLLVTTYLINHGAIQVNAGGERFGDETDTYAHHAVRVQRQPGRVAVEVFDERILRETLANYPRFGECLKAGLVQRAASTPELAERFGLDSDGLARTLSTVNAMANGDARDPFGRKDITRRLEAPFYAIRVTSALVQTLGGLRVDERARVLRLDGTPVPGLFAGGGTAAGLAGDRPEGYLAGTGLLAAFGLGWIAGKEASSAAKEQAR